MFARNRIVWKSQRWLLGELNRTNVIDPDIAKRNIDVLNFKEPKLILGEDGKTVTDYDFWIVSMNLQIKAREYSAEQKNIIAAWERLSKEQTVLMHKFHDYCVLCGVPSDES